MHNNLSTMGFEEGQKGSTMSLHGERVKVGKMQDSCFLRGCPRCIYESGAIMENGAVELGDTSFS